jgi:tryptophanyl-tRNA synthetase
LSSVTAYGDLLRMHQFKEKSAAQRELVSAALFFYPVLMAADVLAYRANEVPVGDDQRQHVELMRDIAARFNARFGGGEEVLVVPEHRIPEVGARIMDLQDPTTKMSTTGGSELGTVFVLDEPRAIERKIKAAVTDSGTEIKRAPDKPGVSNLIEILAVARASEPAAVEAELGQARGYGELKAAVAAATVDYLAPLRERYASLRSDETALEAVLADGASRARPIAAQTLADVRERMGVGPPRQDGGVR